MPELENHHFSNPEITYGKMSTEQLVTHLQNAFLPYIERGAIRNILMSRRDPSAIAPLLALLGQSEDTELDSLIVVILRAFKNTTTLLPLLSVLAKNPYLAPSVREVFLEISAEDSVPILVDALSHPMSDVRAMAADTLSAIGNEEALPMLEAVAKTDVGTTIWGFQVRTIARRAIRAINGRIQRQNGNVPQRAKTKVSYKNGFAWKELMTEYSKLLLFSNILEDDPPEDAQERGWLGRRGATEKQIVQVEQRLDAVLPPSYRAFLRVTNGWGQINQNIFQLWSTQEVDWLRVKEPDFVENELSYPSLTVSDAEYFKYDASQRNDMYRIEYFRTALVLNDLHDNGENALYLLNPQIVTTDGEWEAWVHSSSDGVKRYHSFWDLMVGELALLQLAAADT